MKGKPRHKQRNLAVLSYKELIRRDELCHLVEIGVYLVNREDDAGICLSELIE